jgi:hypothetical protein
MVEVMMWAMVVFVSRRGTWIVAQEYDQWIVLELVDDEGSIQICDAIRGSWNLKGGGQKVFVNRTDCTVDAYIRGQVPVRPTRNPESKTVEP